MQLDGGRVSLSMEELKAAYPDPQTLVGHSVYVKASVLTKTGKEDSDFQNLSKIHFHSFFHFVVFCFWDLFLYTFYSKFGGFWFADQFIKTYCVMCTIPQCRHV